VQQAAAQLAPVQASANDRMYLRLRGLKPSTPGNSVCRSLAKRSMTLVPPPFRVLPDEDIPAHRPIQEDKFPVDGKGGPDLSTADAGFELLQEFPVAGGQLKGIFHCRQHSQDIAPDKNHCRW